TYDEIVFQEGLRGTIVLNGTELIVSEPVKITGPGGDLLTIDAQQNSRHFRVGTGGIVLELDGFTLTGGHVAGNGGAILIENGSRLSVQNSTIHNNTAMDGGGIYAGGGGGFGTNLGIHNSEIRDNSAVNGGGIYSTYHLNL